MSDCFQPIAFALDCFQLGIYVGCISLFFSLPSALHSQEQPKLMWTCEDFFCKSMRDSLAAKLTNRINKKLQS